MAGRTPRMFGVAWALFALGMAFASADVAHAGPLDECLRRIPGVSAALDDAPATTCDEGRRLCCEWWYADVIREQRVAGGALEDSFEKLQRSIERSKETAAWLCRNGFRDDCTAEWSAPRCWDGAHRGGSLGEAASGARGRLDDAERRVADAIERARRASERFGALHDGVQGVFGPVVDGPYAGIGTGVAGWGAALDHALARLRALRGCLQSTVVPDFDARSWYAGPPDLWRVDGSFGGHEEIDDLVRRIDGVLEGANAVVAAQPVREPPAVELPKGARVVSATGSTNAALVMGRRGRFDAGSTIDAGTWPLAFVAREGSAWTIGTVKVVSDPTRPERLTLRAEAGALTMVIELELPPADGDGDGVVDREDRCPKEPGQAVWRGCPRDPDAPVVAACEFHAASAVRFRGCTYAQALASLRASNYGPTCDWQGQSQDDCDATKLCQFACPPHLMWVGGEAPWRTCAISTGCRAGDGNWVRGDCGELVYACCQALP